MSQLAGQSLLCLAVGVADLLLLCICPRVLRAAVLNSQNLLFQSLCLNYTHSVYALMLPLRVQVFPALQRIVRSSRPAHRRLLAWLIYFEVYFNPLSLSPAAAI